MSTNKTTVGPEDFSFCGIDCKKCDVFKATTQDDQEARLRAAKLFEKTAKEHWKMDTLEGTICKKCPKAAENTLKNRTETLMRHLFLPAAITIK